MYFTGRSEEGAAVAELLAPPGPEPSPAEESEELAAMRGLCSLAFWNRSLEAEILSCGVSAVKVTESISTL